MPEDEQTGGKAKDDQAAAGQQGNEQQKGAEDQGQGQQGREQSIPRERFDEVNQQLADTKARNQWLEDQYYSQAQSGGQPGTQASPQRESADSGSENIPKDFNTWDEWHATDPGQATDWRTRRAYRQERQLTDATEGRQRFLNGVYDKSPDLQDPIKRNSNPTYRQFTSLLKANPSAGATESGLNQLWELAEHRVGGGTQSKGQGNERQAGAAEERQRQAAAGAMYSPSGTGTQQQGQQRSEPVQLSPKAERVRAKYGMSPEEFQKGMNAEHEDEGSRIPMHYKKAQRPK